MPHTFHKRKGLAPRGVSLMKGGMKDTSTNLPAVALDMRTAKFRIGQVVKHRVYPFRGVIFDVDPVLANTEEWYASIPPEIRPSKDQPFYHLLAENAESTYIAYVSEQNLLPDESGKPVGHPQIDDMFAEFKNGRYTPRQRAVN
jgi:heat shock protein HspQ